MSRVSHELRTAAERHPRLRAAAAAGDAGGQRAHRGLRLARGQRRAPHAGARRRPARTAEARARPRACRARAGGHRHADARLRRTAARPAAAAAGVELVLGRRAGPGAGKRRTAAAPDRAEPGLQRREVRPRTQRAQPCRSGRGTGTPTDCASVWSRSRPGHRARAAGAPVPALRAPGAGVRQPARQRAGPGDRAPAGAAAGWRDHAGQCNPASGTTATLRLPLRPPSPRAAGLQG